MAVAELLFGERYKWPGKNSVVYLLVSKFNTSNIDDPELISIWRKHMVEFLSVRGAPWIKDGDLAVLKKSILHGPNFPA